MSVPAKAVEFYLDARRLIEEQVRVCAFFFFPDFGFYIGLFFFEKKNLFSTFVLNF